MKIGNSNTRLFLADFQNQSFNGANNKGKLLNFFHGNHQASQDKVAQKRQEARERAMKLVKDVYSADRTVDEELAEREGRVEQAKNEILEANNQKKELDHEKEKLKETYGITEDSQEQKDLKLLEKRRDSMKPDSDIQLTDEERQRLAEIDEKGMTEYQKASLEIDSWKAPYDDAIDKASKTMQEENGYICAIHLERLKRAPMVAAANQADEIMEAANKEIIGMIIDDTKNNIDEKMEETKEDMDEAKEEKEELDEKIEEIQEKNEEMEAATQAQREEHKKYKPDLQELPTDQILQVDGLKNDIQQEVKDMLLSMKLLPEDIKGSVVDTGL